MITCAELAEKIKLEIVADMKAGVVPHTIRTFSELHDYVDANCYGGTEALLEELDAAYPQTDEGHTAALDQLCDLMNPAMEIINRWLAEGGAFVDGTVIPRTSDRFANQANMAAIDRLIRTRKYPNIVAWGKLLGFTPKTVQEQVDMAEAENAPMDAIQKIHDKWLCLDDIDNEQTRARIKELANSQRSWKR